jgi:hypothetical protein
MKKKSARILKLDIGMSSKLSRFELLFKVEKLILIDHFLQLRLKKLVYHIFYVSSTDGLEECFIFPEWQFIQYILPCFVTLIGQHATNPKTKQCELLAYTRFVHNLIQSFELKLNTKNVKGEPSTLIQYKPKDVPDWVCVNVAKNLVVQLEEVESDLGMLIYGSYKRMKRADTAEIMQGQIFFRLLKETLKTTTFERGESTIFRCWGETLLQLVPRMKEALLKEVLLPTNPFPVNNLLRAMVILHDLKHIVATFNLDPVDEIILKMLNVADQKVKTMLAPGKQQSTSRGKLDKMKRFLEFQKLTAQQLLGSVLFFLVLSWRKEMPKIVNATQMFQSSHENVAVDKYIKRDLCGLRAVLTPLLSDEDGNDLSMLTVDFSKKKATFYEQITSLMKSGQSQKDILRKRLLLTLLPVFPVKLCRCCHKFEGLETIKLSMCTVCVDNRDFSDMHWFCSKECEEKVLAEGHLEEHAQFLMVKLGLV